MAVRHWTWAISLFGIKELAGDQGFMLWALIAKADPFPERTSHYEVTGRNRKNPSRGGGGKSCQQIGSVQRLTPDFRDRIEALL